MVKICKILSIAVAALLLVPAVSNAQNLSAVKNKAHANLLAKQQTIQNQIRVKEVNEFASSKYEEQEPEPDIYTEGWDSGLVNPFKESDVPSSRVINVRNYQMPLKKIIITSRYGYRPRFGRNHKGIDFGCPVGDTVRSAFSGKVRLTKFDRGGYGFYVIVRHENGLETVYGHLSRFLVQPGQTVKAGQPIACSGNTGLSTGPHLHFETRFMGYAINPEAIFDFNNRTTHTDTYTFTKSTYTQSRSYSPSARYSAAREQAKAAPAVKAVAPKVAKKAEPARSTYKVRQGDNLGKIAARNGVSVAQLKKLNGLTGDKIQPGKSLRIK